MCVVPVDDRVSFEYLCGTTGEGIEKEIELVAQR